MNRRWELRRAAAERSRKRRRDRGELRQPADADVQVGDPNPGPPCTLCGGSRQVQLPSVARASYAFMTCPRCSGRGVDPGL